MSFFDEIPKKETKTESEPKTDEIVNLSTLFEKEKYRQDMLSMVDMLKMTDILNVPIVITGYSIDTMRDSHTNKEKECFRMDFYFAEDDEKIPHYVRSEASVLWRTLKVIEKNDPELLNGKICTMILKDEKKQGSMTNTPYYFAGTIPSK